MKERLTKEEARVTTPVVRALKELEDAHKALARAEAILSELGRAELERMGLGLERKPRKSR